MQHALPVGFASLPPLKLQRSRKPLPSRHHLRVGFLISMTFLQFLISPNAFRLNSHYLFLFNYACYKFDQHWFLDSLWIAQLNNLEWFKYVIKILKAFFLNNKKNGLKISSFTWLPILLIGVIQQRRFLADLGTVLDQIFAWIIWCWFSSFWLV